MLKRIAKSSGTIKGFSTYKMKTMAIKQNKLLASDEGLVAVFMSFGSIVNDYCEV